MSVVALAALSALLASAALVSPGCKKKPAERLAEAGPEDWVVDDAAYHLLSTHYERGPGNTVFYVMTYPAPKGTSAATVDKDGAGILVWPLVKYAYNNKTFMRAQIPPDGASTPPKVRLAVDLVTPDSHKLIFRHEVAEPQ